MLFPVDGNTVWLPLEHPLADDGFYPCVALIECAAQLAGRAVTAPLGNAGMLVEVGEFIAEVDAVAVGRTLTYVVSHERTMGQLWRFRVQLVGVLSVAVTIRVG